MQKIGNIVTRSKTLKFDNIFNVVSKMEEIDKQLPTLIIGYKLAEELIEGFRITKEEYDNDVYWAFLPHERRDNYKDMLQRFRKVVVNKFIDGVKYEYINFPCYTLNKLKRFIKYMKSNDKKLLFHIKRSGFLFIYSQKYSTVWGLSLSLCQYLGISWLKIINKVSENKNNKFVKDFSVVNGILKNDIDNNETYKLLPICGLLAQN